VTRDPRVEPDDEPEAQGGEPYTRLAQYVARRKIEELSQSIEAVRAPQTVAALMALYDWIGSVATHAVIRG
jgi:hypothetical protein